MEFKLLTLLCVFIHTVNCDDKPNIVLLFADDVSSTCIAASILYSMVHVV